jgi:RsiW-degrading membrane proteinase PrsW (M82 family)
MLRAFTAVPAHAVFAIFMGYYVGLAKYNSKNRYKYLSLALIIPVLIHGTYDLFILQQYFEWLMLLATLTLCISAFFAIKVVRLHQQNSPFRELFIIESTDFLERDISGTDSHNYLNPTDPEYEEE